MNDFPHIKATRRSISLRRLVYGVGVNDSDYMTHPTISGKKITCQFYSAWKNMIERCYCAKTQKKYPTYRGCTVDPEWYSFMSFRKWMSDQDWKGKQLDKDILKPGNKIYSPKTCLFVSSQINSLLTSRSADRGSYPMGVSWDKDSKKFKAYVNIYGKPKNLGRFNTAQDAHNVARKAKAGHITDIAQTQLEPIRSALLHHARLFLDVCNEKIKLST